jgi:predicted O-methyltransferase YrrM
MVPLLEEILRTKQGRSVDGSEVLPLDSAITPDVGGFLQTLIRQRKPKTTLEVGLAFGVSALFICEALQEYGGLHHIAIDAFQSTQWKGIGVNNLKLAGFGNLAELRESYSHLALAELEALGTRIDFAFIDGWHAFDSALTDFFHVYRLLSLGGVVVFDDPFFPGVHEACRYVATNRAYRVVATTEQVADYKPSKIARLIRQIERVSPQVRKLFKSKFVIPDETLGFTPDCRCIAFEKVGDDKRGWSDHAEF